VRAERVILSATSFAEARDALELATDIAARLDGDLQGLLIEQEAVLALIGLPAGRVIGSHGRRLSGLDAAGMEAAFRGDARRFEEALARAAEATALRWSFRHRKGRVGVILGGMMEAAGTLLVASGAPRRGPLREIVLVLGTGADTGLARLASEQAARIARPLRLLLPEGAEPPAGVVPAVIERFRGEADLHAKIAALDPYSLLFAEMGSDTGSLSEVAQEARCTCILHKP
jgi:hypothetical protein